MALLFYGGIMNLYWIVGLALYVPWRRPSRRSLAWPHRRGAADRLGRALMLVVLP